MKKAKQLAMLWGRLGERLGRNVEETDGKVGPSFKYPSIFKKYNHGATRNNGNVGSGLDLSCGGGRVRPPTSLL